MAEERFTGVEIKVGAVVVLVAVIFVVSLLYIGYKKDLFAPKMKFWLRADTGQDLSRGMPVKFSGFRIGAVKDLYLEQDGSMKLKLSILEKYSKWVRTDSQFLLAKEGMIGPPVIVLKTGKGSPAREGAEFVLMREKGLEALADEVKPVLREVTATISEVHKLLASINDPKGNYQRTLANVEQATRALNQGRGLAKYILHDEDSTRRLQQSLQSLQDLIDNLNRTVQDFSEVSRDIKATIKELQRTLKAINDETIPVLRNLKETSEGLPQLRQKVDYTLELSKDLVLKLHNTWPLNKQEKVQRRPVLPEP